MNCKPCYLECRGRRQQVAQATRAIHRSLGYYPARFPYCVPSAVLHGRPKGVHVLDPFVGSGVTCTVSILHGLNCSGLDINPFSVLLASTASEPPGPETGRELDRLLQGLRNYRGPGWRPRWDNVEYWHPTPVLGVLEKIWGFVHNAADRDRSLAWRIFLVALARVTRAYSYADPDIPKLYRGKKGRERMEALLSKNLSPSQLRERIIANVRMRAHRILASLYRHLNVAHNARARIEVWDTIRGGIPGWARNARMVLTSPPYLAAHEYIRSTKLELYWLGLSDQEVRQLKRLEIPYGPVEKREVHSETYHKFRSLLIEKAPKRLKVYERYFWALAGFLDKLASNKPEEVGLFIGRATIKGIEIPVDEILREHLESLGYKCVCKGEDRIRSRKLFRKRNNANPEGITKEILVIMEKT